MRSLWKANLAACVTAMTIGLGVSAASADQMASLGSCIQMADQVRDAISANAQSPSVVQAKTDLKSGQEFCSSGLYARGTSYYQHALTVLGVPQKS